MSKFWQKTQRRLQCEKKIVPEPFHPRRQAILEAVHATVARTHPTVGEPGHGHARTLTDLRSAE
jgi:hypothetical protein